MKRVTLKTTLIAFVLLTAMGCSKDDDQAQYNLAVGFDMSIKDRDGNDLLDPANPNAFKESDIKLYYVIDGNVEEVFDGRLDSPRNFYIYNRNSEYRIGITQNYTETSDMPITYIKWNDNDTDTITSTFRRGENFVIQEKIFLNDSLIWDGTENLEPSFELIK